MPNKFNINDKVVFKATPNPGEMVVVKITDAYLNMPEASENNPVYHCKYYHSEEKIFYEEQFYGDNLKLVNE